MSETLPLLHVKNMVCPRCISAVEQALNQLGISYASVELGRIILSATPTPTQKEEVAEALKNRGFELLEDSKSMLISQIKSLLIEQIQHSENRIKENFSSFISERLNHEYTYLSKLFSQVEGVTIEKYITKLKIERVKELLFYKEESLSQIADQVGYSSVAYLSSLFKKETGMTPTVFKRGGMESRIGLDRL